MSRFLKFIVNIFLLLAILVAVALLVPPVLGVSTTIVDTPSMNTNLPLGSVTYSRKVNVADLKVGDEVLKDSGAGTYAYLLRATDAASGQFEAVSATDPNGQEETVLLRNEVPKVVVEVPLIGYVVMAMQSLEGRIIIGLVVALVIILFALSELWKPVSEDEIDEDEDEDAEEEYDGTETGNENGIDTDVIKAAVEENHTQAAIEDQAVEEAEQEAAWLGDAAADADAVIEEDAPLFEAGDAASEETAEVVKEEGPEAVKEESPEAAGEEAADEVHSAADSAAVFTEAFAAADADGEDDRLIEEALAGLEQEKKQAGADRPDELEALFADLEASADEAEAGAEADPEEAVEAAEETVETAGEEIADAGITGAEDVPEESAGEKLPESEAAEAELAAAEDIPEETAGEEIPEEADREEVPEAEGPSGEGDADSDLLLQDVTDDPVLLPDGRFIPVSRPGKEEILEDAKAAGLDVRTVIHEPTGITFVDYSDVL